MNMLNYLSTINDTLLADNMEQYKILNNEIKGSLNNHYKHHADGTAASNRIKVEIEYIRSKGEASIIFSTVKLTEYNVRDKISIKSEFVYDANNKLITRRCNQFSYDNHDKLINRLHQRFGVDGKILYKVKDIIGEDEKLVSQIKEEIAYDNAKLTGIYAIKYDANGNRISGTNTTFKYDENDKQISGTEKKYNSEMMLLSEKTDELNTDGRVVFSVEKKFSTDGKQLISQTDREFEYNEQGERTGIFAIRKDENGLQTGGNNRYFMYDTAGKMVTRVINKKFDARLNLLREKTYRYNINNQWIMQADLISNKAVGFIIPEGNANNDIVLLKDAMIDNKFSLKHSTVFSVNNEQINKTPIFTSVQN